VETDAHQLHDSGSENFSARAEKFSPAHFPSENPARCENFPVKKIFVRDPQPRRRCVFRGKTGSPANFTKRADEFAPPISLSTQKVTENLQNLSDF